MNLFTPTALVALVSLFFATTTPTLMAQEKVKKIPFHGKLSAVDTSAQTITLVGKKSTRVFHLTSTTKITDGTGAPSSLAAATVGEDVGGSYDKATMTLFSVRFGAKTGSGKSEAAEEPAPAPAAAAPAAAPAPAAAATTTAAAPEAAAPEKEKKKRFSGKVVSVDAAAGTLVVHGLTLVTTGSTKITDATGASIGLSALAAGDKVTGSYVASADGKMTVASLKKGK